MTGIHRFEDIIAWQKARTLTKSIYEITQSGSFSKDYELKAQIRRAAISTMSNIAEGYERGGAKEFRQFLSIAKASCAELRSQLYVAADIGYLQDGLFRDLLTQSEEVGRIIGGLRASVQNTRSASRE
jgi:four helix bundle protein